ncbi:unnamed protein product, partial [Brenthis ino]
MTLAERKNAATLLQYTTVTPFTYLLFPSSYKCLYCEEKKLELQILLEHSRNHDIPNHNNILKNILKKGKKKIKVDISNLKCRICETPFSVLEDAQKHLMDVHKKDFTSAGSGMIAFNLKVTNDVFTCHICSKTFHSFFLLNKHISIHYSNAVCESCGKGFLSYQRLLTHIQSHYNGTYPCVKCKKIFPSTSKLKYHSDKVHGKLGQLKLAKCHKCLARFEHHYEKIKHLKDSHGVEFTFKCETCALIFKRKTGTPNMDKKTNNNNNSSTVQSNKKIPITSSATKKVELKKKSKMTSTEMTSSSDSSSDSDDDSESLLNIWKTQLILSSHP